MADIRTTPELDTFIRPDESPLSDGGNWTLVDSGDYPLELELISHRASGVSGLGGNVWTSRWLPLTLDNDIELWGRTQNRQDAGESYSQRLFANTGGAGGVIDGYIVNWYNNGGDDQGLLYRMDNAVATLVDSYVPGTQFIDDTLLLLRTNGTHVQTYYSTDAGGSWTLANDVVDNTYRTGLKLVLAMILDLVVDSGWVGFGGGQAGTLETTNKLPYLGVGP